MKKPRAPNENSDLIRTKPLEKGTSPLDKEEECVAALEERAVMVGTSFLMEDALDEVGSSHRAHGMKLLHCTASCKCQILATR